MTLCNINALGNANLNPFQVSERQETKTGPHQAEYDQAEQEDEMESDLLDRLDSTEILPWLHKLLSTPHIDDLRRSGLTEETIEAAGIYSAGPTEVSQLLGFKAVSGGLVIPYLNVDEPYARVKLDTPGRDGTHYRSPKDSENRLYVPPLLPPVVLSGSTQPLWITEGEKKALKGCQEGLSCLALSGVWSWRTRDEGNKSVSISDLDRLEWKGRIVTIAFDSDASKNVEVARAEKELAKELARRGATVFVVRLPPGEGGEKVGLDDYLVRYSIEAFRALPRVQAAPRILAEGLGRFLSREFPPGVPLIKGILSSEGSGWIAGEEKMGKSIYALEEALCLALGIPVCGMFEVPVRQRVLFIEEEDSPQRVKARVDALLRGHGFDPDDPGFRAELDQWFQVAVWQSVTLDDADMVLSLDGTIERFKPRVVYLDAMRKLTTRDLSPQQEASKLVNILDDLRRRHGCIFRVLHHYRKGQGYGRSGRGSQEISGSFVFGAWAEVSLFFEPIGKQYGVAKLQVQTKDGIPPDPFKLVIESEGPNEAPTVYQLRIEELGKDAKAQEFKEKVYGLVGTLPHTDPISGDSGVSVKTICEALGLNPDNNGPRKVLKALEQEGRLAIVGMAKKGANLYRHTGK